MDSLPENHQIGVPQGVGEGMCNIVPLKGKSKRGKKEGKEG